MFLEREDKEKLAMLILGGNQGPVEVYAKRAMLSMKIIDPEEVIKISVPSEERFVLIGNMTLEWKEPEGYICHLIPQDKQTDAKIDEALQVAIKESRTIEMLFRFAASGNATIEIIDRRDIE